MNISFRYCGVYYSVLASGTVDIEACNDGRLEVRAASDDFKLWGMAQNPTLQEAAKTVPWRIQPPLGWKFKFWGGL